MTDLAQQLTQSLESRTGQALELLQRMVGINSFTTNAKGVDALGRLTAAAFADLGFTAEHAASVDPEHGDHLFLHRKCPGRPRILLVSHLDTVYPPEEEVRNDFKWEPAPPEDRIYGPGTIDIKGGTVLIWMLLHALRECLPEVYENTDWCIACNAAEEVMSRDFADQTSARFPHGAAAVLVFEGGPIVGGDYHLVTARKGRSVYRITAQGRGAHAGSAFELGVNAVVGLADTVKLVAALSDSSRELTVNIGGIQGGGVLNRVPHEAALELEMRAYDPQVLEQTGHTLEGMARPMAAKDVGLEVTCLGKSPGWPADARTLGLAHHWVQAAEQMGLRAQLVKRGGLSDANYLCHLGPTLDGLGPSGANAHCSERTADGSKVPEYLEPASLVPKAVMNALALVRFLAAD